MHNLDFMLQTLVNLALHYPQAGRTPAQLRILAEDWAEDLAAFPRDIVERAVKAHRRESPYFPTVADIWRRCEALRRGLEAVSYTHLDVYKRQAWGCLTRHMTSPGITARPPGPTSCTSRRGRVPRCRRTRITAAIR